MYYHNCSSIRSKAKTIYSSILANDYDLILFTETWLDSTFNVAEFFPSIYTVFRRDRYAESLQPSRLGGGVIIAVNNLLTFKQLDISCSFGELLAVKIKCGLFWLYIINIYIPFGSSGDIYIGLTEFIAKEIIPLLAEDDQIIIVGDFNLPKIVWTQIDDDFIGSSNDLISNHILDTFCSFGIQQINAIRNNMGRILDLVFTSLRSAQVTACTDLAGSSSIYHTPLLIEINFIEYSVADFIRKDVKFDFLNSDFVSLNNYFDKINWSEFLSNCDVSESVVRFNGVLNAGFDKFVPKKVIRCGYSEPWFNRELKNLVNRKSKASKLYKRSGNITDYEKYSTLRKEFKYLNDFLYNTYILKIEDEISSNPKRFFSFIDGKRKSVGYPAVMSYKGDSVSGSNQICNAFVNFFGSVFENARNFTYGNSQSSRTYNGLQLTKHEILIELFKLDTFKGTGPDGIPSIILKCCALSLAEPLCFMFNMSLQTGIFPDIWKTSFVRPVFKSGNKCDITCYRPINILSVIPKLFELLVKQRLEFVLTNDISPSQHGFVKGKSTITNLMVFSNYLYSILGQRGQVDVIYTDFSKAFDKLDHVLLLEKLDRMNNEFIPISWIASYLTSRTQCVKIEDCISSPYVATSGIPQGSHLGPFLFILFINDIVNCFSFCKCLIYADDVKIYAEVKSISDTTRIQDELNYFHDWTVHNKLMLNTSKCKVMSFCKSRTSGVEVPYILYDETLSRVLIMRDLGVIFSCNLSFNKHIDFIISRANSMMRLIKRHSREFQDPYTLKTLYVTYVRSILEYASIIWQPFYQNHSNRIESIQKQFMLFALRRLTRSYSENRFIREPYENRLKLINLCTLAHRREVANAVFARDIICSRINCPELLSLFNFCVPFRVLRPRFCLLRLPFCGTNFEGFNPVFNVLSSFNDNYDRFDFHMSRELFKRSLT